MRKIVQGDYTSGIAQMNVGELREYILELAKIIGEKETEAAELRSNAADKTTKIHALGADIRDLQRQIKEAIVLAESRQKEIRNQEEMLKVGGTTIAEKDTEIEALRREAEGMNPLRKEQLKQEATDLEADGKRRREAEEAEAERKKRIRAMFGNIWHRLIVGLIAGFTCVIPLIGMFFAQGFEFKWFYTAPALMMFSTFFLFPGLASWLGKGMTAFGQVVLNILVALASILEGVIRIIGKFFTWVLVKVGISDVALIKSTFEDARKEAAKIPTKEKVAKLFLRFCGIFVGIVVGMALWPNESLTAHEMFVSIAGGIAAAGAFMYFEGLMLKVSFHDGYRALTVAIIYILGVAVSIGSAMVTFSELYYRQAERLVFAEARSDLVAAETTYLNAAQGVCEDGIRVAKRKATEAKATEDIAKFQAKSAEAAMFQMALDGLKKSYEEGKVASSWDSLQSSAKNFKDAGKAIATELSREDQKKDLLGKVWVAEKPSPIQLGTRAVLGTDLEGIRTRAFSGPAWLSTALVFIFEGAVLLIGFAALAMRLGRKLDNTDAD